MQDGKHNGRRVATNHARRAAASGDARRARKLTSRAETELLDMDGKQPAIVVAFLPHSATDVDLHEAFQSFGRVLRAAIVKDMTGASKCYGFVSFDSPAPARDAILACCQDAVVMTAPDGTHWSLKASCAEPEDNWGLRTSFMKVPATTPDLRAASATCIKKPVEEEWNQTGGVCMSL